MKKLCIDPGHGAGNRGKGYDPGAVAGGVTEADIVLQFALTIKWRFAQAGLLDQIFFTRLDDRDSNPVGRRNEEAEAARCTHFVSLHCNAGPSSATGVETFYRDDLAWAQTLQNLTLAATGLRDRGIKSEDKSQHDRLAVLDFSGKACLVELGFITSARDRKVLLARDTRLRFANELLYQWGRI